MRDGSADPRNLTDTELRARAAHAVLGELRIFEILTEFKPVLVGTVPLGIDLPTSDLDIVCEVGALERFAEILRDAYGGYSGFELSRQPLSGCPAVLASFSSQGFSVELVGQAIPIAKQSAYRHMIVEERLLRFAGPAAREAIRALKRAGFETEPAFAQYFKLAGDPYRVLSDLYDASAEVLRCLVGDAPG